MEWGGQIYRKLRDNFGSRKQDQQPEAAWEGPGHPNARSPWFLPGFVPVLACVEWVSKDDR
jgi:hypothetical protein